jgi:hypothetical protein
MMMVRRIVFVPMVMFVSVVVSVLMVRGRREQKLDVNMSLRAPMMIMVERGYLRLGEKAQESSEDRDRGAAARLFLLSQSNYTTSGHHRSSVRCAHVSCAASFASCAWRTLLY